MALYQSRPNPPSTSNGIANSKAFSIVSLTNLYNLSLKTKISINVNIIDDTYLFGIIPWNNNYIFATLIGVIKNKFVLIDLDKKDIEKEFDELESRQSISPNEIFPVKMEALAAIYQAAGPLYEWYCTRAKQQA